MTTTPVFPLEGGCDCRQVPYRLQTAPLVVRCCHCRWCQRESGSAFALDAVIEADRAVAAGEPELVDTPSDSGLGQQIARCPRCRVALWSHCAGAGPLLEFVPAGTPAVPECYRREDDWPYASIARFERLMPAIRAWLAAHEEQEQR